MICSPVDPRVMRGGDDVFLQFASSLHSKDATAVSLLRWMGGKKPLGTGKVQLMHGIV